MEPTNFSEALLNFVDIGRDIITILPTKSSGLWPYWVKCFESFSSAITLKKIQDYDINNTSEIDRFPNLRKEFSNLYEFYTDEFSSDLLIVVDGKKQINDAWLRIGDEENTLEEEEDEVEIGNIFSGLSYNRNISIVVKKKTPGTKKVDIELPISEMFEAAISIKKSGIKKPNYPLAIIYSVYKCIMFSREDFSPKMTQVTQAIFGQTVRQENDLNKRISDASKFIAPLMKSNADIMDGLLEKVSSGIDEIEDDSIDEISKLAQEQIAKLDSSSGTSLQSIFSNFMPGSDVDEELEKKGLSVDSIREMVDRKGSGAINNEDLLKSIPGLGDIIG